MARLPQVGGDAGNWGTVLNEFLSETHDSDGKLKNNVVGADNLQDGSVGPFAIADNAVSEAKLSSAVRTKLNATGTSDVADDSVSTVKLTNGAVTDAKVSATAAIAQSKIANLTSDLAGKANTAHTHDIADITSLQASLAGKANSTHTHAAGDITSGTIASGRLPVATETSVGVVELATVSEAVAGTDTSRAVTPAGLASVVSSIPGGNPWAYGIYPRVVWTGSAWPSRASAVPDGYTGAVEYWSAASVSATPPTDQVAGDIWTRVGTV